MTPDPDRTPVIACVGEISDRTTDPTSAMEPLGLMAEALHRADLDGGGQLLPEIDALFVVNQISGRYLSPAQQLAAKLKLRVSRQVYGEMGGHTPTAFLHEAAMCISRGDARVVAIVGGEAHRTEQRAIREGLILPWMHQADAASRPLRAQDRAHPTSKRLGAHLPTTVYPFFENASAFAWGQSPREARCETAHLWAAMSEVAARNPHAWLQSACTAEEVGTPSDANRMIAWPYSKLMVANIAVNQGAAVILVSLAKARELGLDDGRLVFVHGGWSAFESADYLSREDYAFSRARNFVLERAAHFAHDEGFSAAELYSCFPCVPKAARRALCMAPHDPQTVAGGLTFFGAPLNNYMTHAAAAMVRHFRSQAKDGLGLLYAQGGLATSHWALALGSRPPGKPVEAEHCARPGVVAYLPPKFVELAEGIARLETYTVIHGRDGTRHGAVIVRTETGARALARVSERDGDTLALLEADDVFPIHRVGRLRREQDILEWIAA